MNRIWYVLIVAILLGIGIYFWTKKKPEPPPRVLEEVPTRGKPFVMQTRRPTVEDITQVKRPETPVITTEGQDYVIQTQAMPKTPLPGKTPRLKQTTAPKVAGVRSRITVQKDLSGEPKLVAPRPTYISPRKAKSGVAWDVMLNKPPGPPPSPQTEFAQALSRGGTPMTL